MDSAKDTLGTVTDAKLDDQLRKNTSENIQTIQKCLTVLTSKEYHS